MFYKIGSCSWFRFDRDKDDQMNYSVMSGNSNITLIYQNNLLD
jgi:hypothetical protein